MNIALFVPGFPGSEEEWFVPCLSDLAEDLAREARVGVYALKYPQRSLRYSWKGLPVCAAGRSGGGAAGPRQVLSLLRGARADHRRQAYQAAVALWGDETALVAALFSRLEGLPLLLKLSGGEAASLPARRYGALRSPWQRFCLGAGARRAVEIAVGSRIQLQAWERLGLRGAPRPRLLPFGVDTERFAPDAEGAGPGEERLLAVGSLVPVKGFDLLLRALAPLVSRHPRLTLRVIGDGPERERLQALAEGLDWGGRVEWPGWVEHRRLPEAYRQAGLFVSASLHEAQGMAALEAMASGLPVVGSATGILPELLEQEGAGILCTPGDAAALEKALEIALAHRRLWPAMGRRARRIVCGGHTRAMALDRWREALERLAAGG